MQMYTYRGVCMCMHMYVLLDTSTTALSDVLTINEK